MIIWIIYIRALRAIWYCVYLTLANDGEDHNGGDYSNNDQEAALLLARILLVDRRCGELLGGRVGGHANRCDIRLDGICAKQALYAAFVS